MVEIASNDGYLLQHYHHEGIPVLGIDPAANIARVARDERGIPTLCEFFGTTNEAERQAVDDSFARSVLWGFKVEAEEGDRVLVDATAFFMRDAHGVVDRLRQAQQGNTGSTTAAARSICRARKGSPRTPRSRRR